jgi:hypothetical protein
LQLCRRTDHVETRSPPYVDPHFSRWKKTRCADVLVRITRIERKAG